MVPRFARPHLALACVGFLGFPCGCATFRRPASVTPDRAFIEYWPPADSGKLRLAVKDLIDMKGVVTTAGSEFLAKNSQPAKRDAACLAIARARGVQFVGKTNTTELAVGVSGLNEYFGTPKNPLSRRRLIPGGSSSGSAVAVANNMADVAFGTDTAGSIRFPSACCGIVGLKTTFGRIPIKGVYPIAPTELDTVGPMARNIKGTVTGMDLLEDGFAAKYRGAVAAHPDARQIRIGRLYLEGTDPKVDRAVDQALARTGFQVVKLNKEFARRWDEAQKDAADLAGANAWVNMEKYRAEPGITLRTKAVVAFGEAQFRAKFHETLARRKTWKAILATVFREVDFLALPTMKKLPPPVPLFGGSVTFEVVAFGLQNTSAANLGGVPALAMPVPIRHWLIPVTSLQLVGPPRSEADLLNAGRLVEAACGPFRG